MGAYDTFGLFHPAIAVAFVFPLIGMVVNFAWQTRQRRLQTVEDGKSKIPPAVGPEHLKYGKWLSASVVGIALLGMAHPLFTKFIENQTWTTESFRVAFVILMYVATIASLVLLYLSRPKLWRGIFATLTGMGLILLGSQPEIFRRGELKDIFTNPAVLKDIFSSHYYFGITAALLMIFSLAIVQDIYQDRQNRWRRVHIILNSFALLLFIGQGITGTRDLLEIPLHWQAPVVYQLYDPNCLNQPCNVQVDAPPGKLNITISGGQ